MTQTPDGPHANRKIGDFARPRYRVPESVYIDAQA